MREDLLGYLLGALDGTERERVERQIESQPELEREISKLQSRLDPLREASEEYEPPTGLADRTLSFIDEHRHGSSTAAVALPPATAADADHVERPSLRGAPVELNTRRSIRWYDVAVTACVVLVACALLFPAIVRSRYMAQRTACQNNLRQVAFALHNYSDDNFGYFPAVSVGGNRSFAGIFAPMLIEGEYLTNSQSRGSFVCPSSSTEMSAEEKLWAIPTLDEIDSKSGRDLVELQRQASGDYGYNLGIGVDNTYQPPRNERREYFAIVADAPSIDTPDHRSMNHGGQGQNVVYEDGHIEFVSGVLSQQYGDHPFLSRRGSVEPGLDSNDAVIGRSDTPPVLSFPY